MIFLHLWHRICFYLYAKAYMQKAGRISDILPDNVAHFGEGVIFINREVNQEQLLPTILVLTHGFFGGELIKSAELVIGKMEKVEFIPLTSDISVTTYQKKVFSRLEQLSENDIVLVDLLGGTPSNTVAFFSKRKKIPAIAGLNLSVFISCALGRQMKHGEELIQYILEEAGNSIQQIKL